MTSRYRVDYQLKEHRRDAFIEWIKNLLATPFVLYAIKPHHLLSSVSEHIVNSDATRHYADIFKSLERLIHDDIEMNKAGVPMESRLKQLVPQVGSFFTELPLVEAFYIQDIKRSIGKRRLVTPSFNDIRIILNTAQLLALSKDKKLKLITFDGDITLYDDGMNLQSDSPLIGNLLNLLSRNIIVGIVTAAGYREPHKYYTRLEGLIDAVKSSQILTDKQKENLLIMGGEANFLFRFSNKQESLVFIPENEWRLEKMDWSLDEMNTVLDFAQENLQALIGKLNLPAVVIRKERAVGMIAKPGFKLIREQLEETVLRIDRNLSSFKPAEKIQWCAFNGGSDVWVDIGDKALGVQVLQNYLLDWGIEVNAENTLHVGDQFASRGSNDYASRSAACTCWISSPAETKDLLDDLVSYISEWATW
ncbi:IMP 5'-nucleotidase [Martiniozyma asiatica (nom. inval.)]|nr:IMP 5'-nucleotidase [Martiniozyma asiatica]